MATIQGDSYEGKQQVVLSQHLLLPRKRCIDRMQDNLPWP